MPEEPTLTDVATTLQFCLEQLQLCEQVVAKDFDREIVANFIGRAGKSTSPALSYLRGSGIEPAPLRLEVKGVAVT